MQTLRGVSENHWEEAFDHRISCHTHWMCNSALLTHPHTVKSHHSFLTPTLQRSCKKLGHAAQKKCFVRLQFLNSGWPQFIFVNREYLLNWDNSCAMTDGEINLISDSWEREMSRKLQRRFFLSKRKPSMLKYEYKKFRICPTLSKLHIYVKWHSINSFQWNISSFQVHCFPKTSPKKFWPHLSFQDLPLHWWSGQCQIEEIEFKPDSSLNYLGEWLFSVYMVGGNPIMNPIRL